MVWTSVKMILICVGIAGFAQLASAEAPPGRYVVSAETVSDTMTGLTWQRTVLPGSATQVDARIFCDDLLLDGAADWRLPTIKELQSLLDVRASAPLIDHAAFPLTGVASFWASTPSAAGPFVAWQLNFNTGEQALGAVEFDYHRVRCVR